MSTSQKTLAIMQPTFLPWTGYLEMMNSVDEFVFLDTVEFDHRSWQHRNLLMVGGQPQYVTVPVFTKNVQSKEIRDIRIVDYPSFSRRFIRTLRSNYAKALNFKMVIETIEPMLVTRKFEYLLDLNLAFVDYLTEFFGVDADTRLASELGATGRKSELLVEICRLRGATSYIAPEGSRAYIEAEGIFSAEDLEVHYFRPASPSSLKSIDAKVHLSALHFAMETSQKLASGATGASNLPTHS